MNFIVTVNGSFVGNYKHPSGRWLPGINWAIQIEGAKSGMVVVRTYCSSNPVKDAEKKDLSEKAVLFVQQKLQQGWLPWAGILEVEDDST